MENNKQLRDELLEQFSYEELVELRKMLKVRMNEKQMIEEQMKDEKLFALDLDDSFSVNITGKEGIKASKITESSSIRVAKKTYKLYKTFLSGCNNMKDLYLKINPRYYSSRIEKMHLYGKGFSVQLEINPVINQYGLDKLGKLSRHLLEEAHYHIRPNKAYFESEGVSIDDVYCTPRINSKNYKGLFNSLPIDYCYISELTFWVDSSSGKTGYRQNINEFVRFEDFCLALEDLGLKIYTDAKKGYSFENCVDVFENSLRNVDINFTDSDYPELGKSKIKMKFPNK